MKVIDNEWGWDIEKTVPFLAFRALRAIAADVHGEANVLDLSQGEPGYGFAPSTRSRRFYSYLMLVDTYFNNNQTDAHFGAMTEETIPDWKEQMHGVARDNYNADVAAELISDLDEFTTELVRITKEQGKPMNEFDVIFDIFKFSILSGGRYPNSWGEDVTRMMIADQRTKELGFPVNYEEIITVNGASHGVGMFFKGFGEEGVGFLKPGDTVMMLSPVYAPYTQFVETRGLKLVNVSIDPETGKPDESSFSKALENNDRIKAVILINPNNPTGFQLSREVLEKITDIAEHHNSLILTDDVYAEFFDDNMAIIQVPAAKKRTIRINALSKIERATGVRFGDVHITPEANEYIANGIIEPDCPGFLEKYNSIKWFEFLCKSVGGKTIGVFQHISGMPGPSQILGICHVVLGKEEREDYKIKLREKVAAFYDELGIEHLGNNYYGIVDLRHLEGSETAAKPIEEVLNDIAKQGVVLMPAYRFFSEEDRQASEKRRYFRVSLPNLSIENTRKAARIVKEVAGK